MVQRLFRVGDIVKTLSEDKGWSRWEEWRVDLYNKHTGKEYVIKDIESFGIWTIGIDLEGDGRLFRVNSSQIELVKSIESQLGYELVNVDNKTKFVIWIEGQTGKDEYNSICYDCTEELFIKILPLLRKMEYIRNNEMDLEEVNEIDEFLVDELMEDVELPSDIELITNLDIWCFQSPFNYRVKLEPLALK